MEPAVHTQGGTRANSSARSLINGRLPGKSETPIGSTDQICDALNFDPETRVH
jgi:hypothetical protein